MKIETIMSPCPYIVEAGMPLADARREMEMHGIRHLLVSDEGSLVGVLGEKSLINAVDMLKEMKHSVCAGDVCSDEFIVALRGSSAADICREMADKKSSCAVVIDDEERAVGIFTTTDACRVLSRLLDKVENA